MHKLAIDICDAIHLNPNYRPKVSIDYSYEPTSAGLVKREFKVTRVRLMNTDKLCNEINKMRFGECYRLYHEFKNDYQIFAAIDGRKMYIMDFLEVMAEDNESPQFLMAYMDDMCRDRINDIVRQELAEQLNAMALCK